MTDVPVLDTIDFESLSLQARGLIPRFAPGWTDHNLHDPGITILDLFAWITDLQIYRIGFVSDAQVEALAALMGVRAHGAGPARGVIVIAPGALLGDRDLRQGARALSVGQPDLPFAVAADMHLSAARLVGASASRRGLPLPVEVRLDQGRIEIADQADTVELMFDRPLVPADGGSKPVGLGIRLDSALPDPGAGARKGAPVSVAHRAGEGAWRRAPVRHAENLGERWGAVIVEVEPAGDAPSTLRVDFETGGSPVPGRPREIAFNGVPIVQAEAQQEAVLGESNGLPDQSLPVDAVQIMATGAAGRDLDIRTGDAPERPWTKVGRLDESGPEDRHYMVEAGGRAIRFGNGVNGSIPPAGAQIVRKALVSTLGRRGNLAGTLAWTIAGIDTLGPALGVNPGPVAGGRDAWSQAELLAELKRRARARLAMLTNADLSGAAEQLPGFRVERAEVLPRFSPIVPGGKLQGARTLVLHPAEGVDPTDAYLDAIDRALRPRRVLGERLAIVAARAVPVDVRAWIRIAPGSDAERVRRDAETVLRARLGAHRRDGRIEPWPTGRTVTVGELEGLISGVEGVLAVTRLLIGRPGDALKAEDMELQPTEIAVAVAPTLILAAES